MTKTKPFDPSTVAHRSAILGLTLLLAAALATATGTSTASADELTDATEIMKQAHLNLYYAATDGQATVDMVLTDKKGKTRTRKFIMYRLDLEEGGQQKYYIYFLEPGDVRRTAFMVWKEPDTDDSRWLYVPAIDLVRRMSANDKKSSFVGSDFSYEDVSGRHWSEDTHVLLRSEEINGRMAYVVESTPKAKKDSFKRKLTWVDAEYLLQAREEYYDRKDRLERVFEALKFDEVDGVRTIVERKMTNVRKDHSTTITFRNIGYDVGVEESLFSERYLKAPPAKLIQK